MAESPWGNAPAAPAKSREWELLEKVALASVAEQRRSRRWSVFFKLTSFVFLFFMVWLIWGGHSVESVIVGEHTAVVAVNGEISDGSEANAEWINEALRAAFAAPNSKAVILKINSPGGSPVQSAYVYDEIRRLRGLHKDKKLYAVITDMGASGAYYMASAADQIYVSQGSLVGSIGVIMQGFGVQGLMQRLGVEDRTMTAGEHKSILSPFSAVKPEEQAHIKLMLDTIHQQFITAVKQGRGQRLKNNPDIFSGLFWTGQQAVELGLADGFGSVESVARVVVGAEKTEDYTTVQDPLSAMMRRFGVTMGESVAARLIPMQAVQLR